MEFEEFEILEFSDEEKVSWIDMLVKENLREKVLVYDPEALKRINSLKQRLQRAFALCSLFAAWFLLAGAL